MHGKRKGSLWIPNCSRSWEGTTGRFGVRRRALPRDRQASTEPTVTAGLPNDKPMASKQLSTRPQTRGNHRPAPLWRAAAEHDPLCFRSSPVPGRQPLSGDWHGPDAALDSSGLMTAPCQPRVQAPPAGIKRRRRGADGANARLPSEHRLEPAPIGFDQIAPLCRRTPRESWFQDLF